MNTDLLNENKSLKARVARLQEECAQVYVMLSNRGIRFKSVATGLRHYFKRVKKAKELLS